MSRRKEEDIMLSRLIWLGRGHTYVQYTVHSGSPDGFPVTYAPPTYCAKRM